MRRLVNPRQITQLQSTPPELDGTRIIRGSAFYSEPACWLYQSRSGHNAAMGLLGFRLVLRRRVHVKTV